MKTIAVHIGQVVKVTTDWTDFFKLYVPEIRRKYVTVGRVVKSEKFDAPNTLRLFVGKPNHTYAVIHFDNIVEVV